MARISMFLRILLLTLGVHMVGAAAAAAQAPTLCTTEVTYQGGYVPYCRNRSLADETDTVTRAIVFVHGESREASTYYKNIVDAMRSEPGLSDKNTTVIAPQFLLDSDIAALGLSSSYYYWDQGSDWVKGWKAENGKRPSSFEVLDVIVQRLIEHNSNLKHIVVAGFSAGGQALQRYAGVGLRTEFDGKSVQDYAEDEGVTISFVVSSASTYMWLEGTRPESTAGCPNFDDYGYGLSNLDGTAYLDGLDAATIRRNYLVRSVYHIVGSKDTGTNATSCESQTQGKGRLDRMSNFVGTLDDVCRATFNRLGEVWCPLYVSNFGAGTFFTVSNADHNSRDVFHSSEGRRLLFDLH